MSLVCCTMLVAVVLYVKVEELTDTATVSCSSWSGVHALLRLAAAGMLMWDTCIAKLVPFACHPQTTLLLLPTLG